MKTPKQLETLLIKANTEVMKALRNGDQWSQQIKTAKQTYKALAEHHGSKTSPKIFSQEISKLKKDEKTTLGLALLPAQHSNVANLCAFADSCASTCVAFSGNGSYSSVMKSRQIKTEFLTNHPAEFLTLMLAELFQHCDKNGAQNLAVRLNTYSDLRWEKICPDLFHIFGAVQFYDYTKHTSKSRPADSMPKNYHLTYSVSERTTLRTLQECKDSGRPLAVVVEIRSGTLPGNTTMREIPATWGGMQTVDGDNSDARYLTPKNSVVILRRKHTMKANHPMITSAAKLERGLK